VQVGAAADTFALGVMAYQLACDLHRGCTGDRHDHPGAWMHNVGPLLLVPYGMKQTPVGRLLGNVLAGCMLFAPDERPSMEEVSDMLGDVVAAAEAGEQQDGQGHGGPLHEQGHEMLHGSIGEEEESEVEEESEESECEDEPDWAREEEEDSRREEDVSCSEEEEESEDDNSEEHSEEADGSDEDEEEDGNEELVGSGRDGR
jgi:hypothetical protein